MLLFREKLKKITVYFSVSYLHCIYGNDNNKKITKIMIVLLRLNSE